MNLKRISTLLAIMPTCVAANSQQAANDTLTGRISEVTIMSWRKHDKDLLPAQTLSGKQLESLSAQSVADAIRFFSGVQIKDYGASAGSRRSTYAAWEQTTWVCSTTALSWATRRTGR